MERRTFVAAIIGGLTWLFTLGRKPAQARLRKTTLRKVSDLQADWAKLYTAGGVPFLVRGLRCVLAQQINTDGETIVAGKVKGLLSMEQLRGCIRRDAVKFLADYGDVAKPQPLSLEIDGRTYELQDAVVSRTGKQNETGRIEDVQMLFCAMTGGQQRVAETEE